MRISESGHDEALAPVASTTVNALPGPVRISDTVRAAFAQPPLSHRSTRFLETLQETRATLCSLVHAQNVALLMGSGTLANDVVAAQLTLLQAPGLVVVTGEFGDRLADHARRFGLAFTEVRAPWGQAAPYEAIRRVLDGDGRVRWLWAVHCETSTGAINDLDILAEISKEHDVRLCVDAVSTIGSVPVDLAGAHLATGVSGKGLASYPGLAMVFYHHDVAPASTLPRYLDLGVYAQAEGVPYTASSNLLLALAASLESYATPDRRDAVFESRRRRGTWLRGALETGGFTVMASETVASPTVFTIELPPAIDSRALGDHLARHGFLVSYRSAYLCERNVVQICLMADLSQAELGALIDCMRGYMA